MGLVTVLRNEVKSRIIGIRTLNRARFYTLNVSAIEAYLKAHSTNPKSCIEAFDQGENALHYFLSYKMHNEIFPKNTIPSFYVMEQHRQFSHIAAVQEYPEGVKKKFVDLKNKIWQFMLEPYNNNNEDLSRVLLTKNKEGNTALYCAYQSMPYREIKPLLARIAQMDCHQQTMLFLAANEKFTTIAHLWAQNYHKLTKEEEKIFGHVLAAAMLCFDADGRTPLHYLAHRKYCTLTETFINKITDNQVLQQIAMRQDKFGYTVYDYALESNNYGLLRGLAARLGEMTDLYLKPDKEGCTLFHRAIKKGQAAIVHEYWQKLNMNEQKKLIKTLNERDETILHLACRYGDIKLFELVFSFYSSSDLYSLRDEYSYLEKIVAENKLLSLSSFQQCIKQKNVLFDCYHYLEKTYSDKQAFLKRLTHFLLTLKTLIANQQNMTKAMLPQEDSSFFAKRYLGIFSGSDRYHQFCLLMQYVTAAQLDDFIEYVKVNYQDGLRYVQQHQDYKNLAKSIVTAKILETIYIAGRPLAMPAAYANTLYASHTVAERDSLYAASWEKLYLKPTESSDCFKAENEMSCRL